MIHGIASMAIGIRNIAAAMTHITTANGKKYFIVNLLVLECDLQALVGSQPR